MQLHWQYKDKYKGYSFVAQKDIASYQEMQDFVKETQKNHPLPKDVLWMACNEESKYFLKTKAEGIDMPCKGKKRKGKKKGRK